MFEHHLQKQELIPILNQAYSNINLKNVPVGRFDMKTKDAPFIKNLVAGQDKLNVFLVYTKIRRRAPIFLKLPKRIIRELNLKSVVTPEPGFVWMRIVTNHPYSEHDPYLLALSKMKLIRYPFYKPFVFASHNKKYVRFLLRKRCIDIKSTSELLKEGARLHGKTSATYWATLPIDGQRAMHTAYGKLFDYPHCCIDKFSKNAWKRLPVKNPKEPYIEVPNKIRRINARIRMERQTDKFGIDASYLPYTRCSKDCVKSNRWATAVKEYIKLQHLNTAIYTSNF